MLVAGLGYQEQASKNGYSETSPMSGHEDSDNEMLSICHTQHMAVLLEIWLVQVTVKFYLILINLGNVM